MSDLMQVSETSCRVSSFGPMTDWSWVVAFAEMVMMALMKSPAEVWVEALWSEARLVRSRGMRSWACSHWQRC